MHIHCFTDSPGLALRLIDHFTNLFIGITGQPNNDLGHFSLIFEQQASSHTKATSTLPILFVHWPHLVLHLSEYC